MASLTKEPNGRWAVQVMVPSADGGRKKRARIRLGKMNKRQAEGCQLHIEHLASAIGSGQPLNPDTAAWLGKVDDAIHARLARAGLVEPRQPQERAKLAGFIDAYIKSRIDIKAASRVIFGHVKRNLIECLGTDRPLREISPTDADGVRLAMIREGLADSTIAKRLQRARQMFAAAKRRGLVDSNPFGDVKHNEGNPADRQRYIERATVDRILKACNPTWRLITVLCRYGGLRCPSEVLSLKLAGIDWAAGRIRVDSPKTEHHPGRGNRIIPMFPELRDELQAAWDRAPEGEVYVVCGPDADAYRAAAQGPDGWRNANLRTQFERILKRAGVKSWPKPFQNLRLSRETELAADYPIHVVTGWLGNTPKVAMRHYLTVTDSDFQRATETGANSGARAAHFPAQPVQADNSHNTQNSSQTPSGQALRPNEAGGGQMWPPPEMAGTGRELPPKTPGKTGVAPESGANSGALSAESVTADPDLQRLIAAWPTLPGEVRAGIMMKTHGSGKRKPTVNRR